ncbi:hypothetical protein ES703_68213 [subsurface metagenome]
MKRADVLKINVMCYWRLHRDCPIVALEHDWGASDVLAVTKHGEVIDTEVKCTLHDLKRDKDKTKHLAMVRDTDFTLGRSALMPYIPSAIRTHYFYFAVPQEMKTKALQVIEDMYPYAGLLVVRPNDFYQWDNYHHIVAPVSAVRRARRFTKPKITESEQMDIVRGLSVTACQIAFELLARDRKV